jgi:hypothetical protein
VVFNVAEMAEPRHLKRLGVIVVMPVASRISAEFARLAHDLTTLDGSAESAVRGYGLRVE